MKLSLYSDYALRILIHLATHPGRLMQIGNIAEIHAISRHHLTKIVRDLGQAGFIVTIRGRRGGIRLARPADQIAVGAVLRHTEGICLQPDCAGCIIAPACRLPVLLAKAMRAFMAVLDCYSIHDLASDPQDFHAIFARQEGAGSADVAPPDVNRDAARA